MHDKPSVKGSMRRVVIESPYTGKSEDPEEYAREVKYNLRYLRACMADSFARGEAPYASHGLYTQPGVIDDKIPEERAKGIKAGFSWGEAGELRAFYMDLGMSGGMGDGRDEAVRLGQVVATRFLGGEWEEKSDALRRSEAEVKRLNETIANLTKNRAAELLALIKPISAKEIVGLRSTPIQLSAVSAQRHQDGHSFEIDPSPPGMAVIKEPEESTAELREKLSRCDSGHVAVGVGLRACREIDEARKQIESLKMDVDPPECRLQIGRDGYVPGNARDGMAAWKKEAELLRKELDEARAEITKDDCDICIKQEAKEMTKELACALRRAESVGAVLAQARTVIDGILAMETWAGPVCGTCQSAVGRASDVFKQLRDLLNAITTKGKI